MMEFIKRPRLIAIVFFLFVLPLLLYLGNSSYDYTKAIFALVFISLLLLSWVVEMLWRKDFSLYVPTNFWLGLILLEAALLSLINISNIRVGLESLVMLLFFFLLYLILVNTIKQKRDALLLLAGLFVSAALAALYAMIQYYGYEILYGIHEIDGGRGSMISTFGNKNYLGGFLVYLYIPAIILLLQAKRIWSKIPIFLGLTVVYTAIIVIQSRSVWLALATSALFLAAGIIYFKPFKLIKRNLGWIIALTIMMIIVTAVYVLYIPSIPGGIAKGVKELSDPLYVRYYDFWVTWEMIKAHPFIGIGLGDFKMEFLSYKAKFLQTERGKFFADLYIGKAEQAHNEYLQIWAELGTLGLLITAVIILAIFLNGWRKAKAQAVSVEDKFTILALLAGLVAFLTDSIFSFPLHIPPESLALVLLLAILDSAYLAGEQRFAFKLGRYSKWALAPILLILVFTISSLAVKDFIGDLYLVKGEKLVKEKRLTEAESYFKRSLKWDFDGGRANFRLGVVYIEQKDFKQAREFFKRSLDSFSNLGTYFNLSLAAWGMKNYDEALQYVDQAIQIDPTNLDFLYLKANIYMTADKPNEGLHILQEIVAKNKDYYKAYLLMAKFFQAKNMKEQAIESYKRALEIVERQGLKEEQKEIEARLKELTSAPSP